MANSSDGKPNALLQPQLARGRVAEELGLADVARDDGDRAVAGLAHDVEGGGAVAGGLGREAGPQRVSGIGATPSSDQVRSCTSSAASSDRRKPPQ